LRIVDIARPGEDALFDCFRGYAPVAVDFDVGNQRLLSEANPRANQNEKREESGPNSSFEKT
jgi:hypothetical protein